MHKLNTPFYDAASKLGLQCTNISHLDLLKISLGGKNYYIKSVWLPLNNSASVTIALNKYAMNRLLHDKGFPVSKAIKISREQWSSQPLSELLHGIKFPLVAKPMRNTGRGQDVQCNIKDLTVLSDYFNRMITKYPMIHIEEFQTGLKEYRVTILKNKVVGVVERHAPSVVGDGIHSIHELINIKNAARKTLSRVTTHEPLVYDEEYRLCLEEQGLNRESIIPEGEKVQLCYTVNLGRGGDIFSLGTEIHPQNKRILCRLVREVGLDYSGLDILCEDILQPFTQGKWFVIEANYSSDTTLHTAPAQGKKAALAEAILMHIVRRHPFSYLYETAIKEYRGIWIKLLGIVFLILFFNILLFP